MGRCYLWQKVRKVVIEHLMPFLVGVLLRYYYGYLIGVETVLIFQISKHLNIQTVILIK